MKKKFSLFLLSCIFGHDITSMFWICCSVSVAWDQSDILFFSPVIWHSLPWGCEDCTEIEEAEWTLQVGPPAGSLWTSAQLTGFAFLLKKDLSGDNKSEWRSEPSFSADNSQVTGYRLHAQFQGFKDLNRGLGMSSLCLHQPLWSSGKVSFWDWEVVGSMPGLVRPKTKNGPIGIHCLLAWQSGFRVGLKVVRSPNDFWA